MPTPLRYKAFLFDLDGVLIDSEKEYTKIWNEIDKRYPTGLENFAQRIKGTTLPDILSTYFPKHLHAQISKELHEMQSVMKFYYAPGAHALLLKLKELTIPSAIVTSSDARKMQLLKTQLPEIFSLVDVIIDANQITRSKPHPEGYILAAKSLGINVQECLVAEDAVLGARAGKAAGAYVLGITATMGAEAMQPEADLIVENLKDPRVKTLLEQL